MKPLVKPFKLPFVLNPAHRALINGQGEGLSVPLLGRLYWQGL